MIDDALTNPPMPDWNSIPQELRSRIMREGEFFACECCSPDAPFYIYGVIRDILLERERQIFHATMKGRYDGYRMDLDPRAG